MLAVTILSYAITPIVLSADGPGTDRPSQPAAASSAPTNLAPVYVKIIWPDDRAPTAIEKDRPVIESWIAKSIENGNEAKHTASTAWVPLVEEPLEATDLWDGKLDGRHPACAVWADVLERKDGWIKIGFRGWTPGGAEATLTLKDEPGSREVVPVAQVKTKHGAPHVAVFIGLNAKRK